MSLEGNVRELELQEVFQLLAHGRKSGQLRIVAQLAGLSAVVCFERGAIVDCVIDATPLEYSAVAGIERTRQQVESLALELLTWRDGMFRFSPAAAGTECNTGVRIVTEMLLVEGARRMEGWSRLADRIPHARAVPTFVTAEPQQLPLLHLEPQQWEVLTRVDGSRDLPALADTLGRDLLEVAETVHGLIGIGLLAVVDAARPSRAMATPPASGVSVAAPLHAEDVWVPQHEDAAHLSPMTDDGYDAIFDPVRVGVITPEGLPRLRTPFHNTAVRTPVAADVELPQPDVRQPEMPLPELRQPDSRQAGDDAAKCGDFAEALSKWSAYLKANEHGADADHVREAIALTARLQALLYSGIRT